MKRLTCLCRTTQQRMNISMGLLRRLFFVSFYVMDPPLSLCSEGEYLTTELTMRQGELLVVNFGIGSHVVHSSMSPILRDFI
jgi:hypothetical protein